MQKKICISTIEGVNEFTSGVERFGSPVMVSREGFKSQVDGTSLIGMMSIVGTTVIVDYDESQVELGKLIDRFVV